MFETPLGVLVERGAMVQRLDESLYREEKMTPRWKYVCHNGAWPTSAKNASYGTRRRMLIENNRQKQFPSVWRCTIKDSLWVTHTHMHSIASDLASFSEWTYFTDISKQTP